jgi:hypothetical protein
MATLYQQSMKDLLAPVLTQARVKINATTNRDDITTRSNTREPYHLPLNLPNEPGDQQFLAFPAEICWDYANGKVHPPTPANSSMENNVMKPLSVTFNGLQPPGNFGAGSDEQLAELRRMVFPVGVVDMSNRDNGSSNYNCQTGGSLPVINNGNGPLTTGDYVYMHVPSREEAQNAYSDADVNRGQGGGGNARLANRVVAQYRRFDPHSVNFYDPVNVNRALEAWRKGEKDSHGDPYLAQRGKAFVQGIIGAVAIAQRLNIDDGTINYDDKATFDVALERVRADPALRLDADHNAAENQALQAAVRLLAQLRLEQERLVFARVLTGNGVGYQTQIQVGGYSH